MWIMLACYSALLGGLLTEALLWPGWHDFKERMWATRGLGGFLKTVMAAARTGMPRPRRRNLAAARTSEATPLRRKDLAMLLALFFSYWTWLYTFRHDWDKFFFGLSLAFPSVLLATTIIGTDSPFLGFFPDEYDAPALERVDDLMVRTWRIILSPILLVWLWAIITTFRRPGEWFRNYGRADGPLEPNSISHDLPTRT